MAKYYTRITLRRMSELLDLTVDVSRQLINFHFLLITSVISQVHMVMMMQDVIN